MHLNDKVAIVTGGNSGIGFAIARTFVDEGAQVVIVGRRQNAVDEIAAQLGASAYGIIGDVAELATHQRVADFVTKRFGKADIYVANAGTNVIATTLDVSVDEYDRQFATNARGVFFGVQAILPHIRDGGSIILTSSIATAKVLDGHAAYAGAKAATEAFARSWALELKDRRIRVNVLSPGPTDTPILGKLGIAAEARPALEAQLATIIPLGRLGTAEELGRAALFLASDQSSFITGINLRVDGGISLA
ncbi:SDR family NAD(P)-dependent oxidoreductase [Methylorubrum extorquens]|nr:glucose 1-dehydrogenase [Methylorubrum extorquens]